MSANETTEALPPPGEALARARRASGRSTADVASALKLREILVEDIERDDFSRCGGDAYARWHLRDYAHLVGLDDGPLLEAYAARHGAASTPAPSARAAGSAPHGTHTGPVAPLRLSGPGIPAGPRKPPWSLLAGLALTGLVAYLSVQLVAELRAPARPTQEVASPVTVSPTPAPAPSPSRTATAPEPSSAAPQPRPAPSTSAPQRPAKKPADGVAIALRATGDSWVTVRASSGQTKFSGLLGKGDLKKFKDADGLRVILGNAGGVQLTVNGQRVGAAGRDGEVKRLTIKPGDPA